MYRCGDKYVGCILFSKFISRVQVHDLQDILEVDRNKLEVGMGSVGMGTGKCGNSILFCVF